MVEALSIINDSTLTKVAEALGEEEAITIIDILKKSQEITDDIIASETGIRLNIIRRILYKLYDNSLVILRRTRDPKTGWFIFHWKLQPDQLEGFVLNQKRRVFEKLSLRMEYEKSHEFYHCNTPGCTKITFEDAVEQVFVCSTCSKSLLHFNNDKTQKILTKKFSIFLMALMIRMVL